ncbi:hypothetical protein Tco_0910950 [Tanacetum coccineum]|uniref:Reverse transcriptase/retrotransposon-derived protein RNase H-like domain-containing protein n=1 Tax=Tanacetum coccineum TaxID=301880 RepID=A0ABQ5CUD2_9ASTR
MDVEGAPECMKISGFIHVAACLSYVEKLRDVKQPEGGNKPNFKKGLKNKKRSDRNPDRFSLLTKTPKEIFALEKEKFKAPPPMHGRIFWPIWPAEEADRRDDQVRQIVAIHQRIKTRAKWPKTKEGETAGKDKPLSILMIQQWERVAKQRVAQSFSPETTISFPSLGEEDGKEGPMITEAEIGGHFVHRIFGQMVHPQMVTISTQWNNRQNRHKKDSCRTIHDIWNVKIPGKRRNGNDTKQQSHPDGMCNDLRTPCHLIPSDQPIKQLLLKSEISGRMLKWKFELEGYDIQYRPRTSIKGQILADFIIERPDEESSNELMAEPEELPEPWTLFTDGSSCIDGSGAGLILTNPEGVEFTETHPPHFSTNLPYTYHWLRKTVPVAEGNSENNYRVVYGEFFKMLHNDIRDSTECEA